MPMGASFFYFDLSATPDRTQLSDPPTLTLKVINQRDKAFL